MNARPALVSYWSGLASNYATLGPPLRPSDEDLRCFESSIANWAGTHPGVFIRAVLLGVTPDIASMRWPENSSLVAFDRSDAMIGGVWRAKHEARVSHGGSRCAVQADWRAMPRKDRSCHIVIGDGSLSSVRFPDESRTVLGEIRRILEPSGIALLRCYIQPSVKEQPQRLLDALGEIPSFHEFKLRLLMALQPSAESGISVRDVYRFWARQRFDSNLLSARTGWDPAAIEMMELYRDSETVYSFPTMAELESLLREFFGEIAIASAGRLGETCPIIMLRGETPPR